MAVHYIVNRYLSDCGLPHDPINTPGRILSAYYPSIKATADKLGGTGMITIETCDPLTFQTSLKKLVGDKSRIGQMTSAVVQAAVCAEILASQGRSKEIPLLLAITKRVIIPPRGGSIEILWETITGPLGS